MLKILKEIKFKQIIKNSIFLIIGIMFCFMRGKAVNITETIFSGCLLFYGVICLFIYLFTPVVLRSVNQLIETIFFILCGLLLCWIPSIFVIGIGIIVILEGIKELFYAVNLKQMSDEQWWIDEMIGLVLFGLGLTISILCNTQVALNIISLLIGLTLVVDSGTNLLLILVFHRDYEELKQNIREQNKDDFKDYSIK